MVRKMTFANASKADVQQINYDAAIEGLGISHDQFVDLCILLGCDYCDTIRGIGPKTALKLIREHKNIETILEHIDRKKYVVPDSYVPHEAKEKIEEEKRQKYLEELDTDDERKTHPKEEEKSSGHNETDDDELIPVYVEARRLFNEHEVLADSEVDLKWKECQADELKKFLVDEMGFNADRVQSSVEKLQKAFKASAKPQTRMDSFFSVKPNPNAGAKGGKRKLENDKGGKGKKGKGGGFFKKK